MENFSFIGRGEAFIGLADGSDKMRSLGNVGSAQIAFQADSKKQQNMMVAGGGNFASVESITGIALALTPYEYSPDNLALAEFGYTTPITAGSILDEPHTAKLGGFMSFDNLPDTTVAYVITNAAGTVTYVLGDDYTENNAGIIIIDTADGGSITEDEALLVDYTKVASHVIEALTQSAKEYHIQIAGLNENRQGKAVFNDFFKVKFGAAASLDWLGTDYGEIALVGEVLADLSKVPSSTTSQYYNTKVL